MLYYDDDTIQHGGITIGLGGFAANALWSLTDRDEKYFPFSICEHEMSGVTAACLMVQKEVYEQVGGFDEAFVVALNDVDFCLKIREAGYGILFIHMQNCIIMNQSQEEQKIPKRRKKDSKVRSTGFRQMGNRDT